MRLNFKTTSTSFFHSFEFIFVFLSLFEKIGIVCNVEKIICKIKDDKGVELKIHSTNNGIFLNKLHLCIPTGKMLVNI